jgi:hypothetical protein
MMDSTHFRSEFVPTDDDQVLISGGWERVGSRMVADHALQRIHEMIATKLEKIADAGGGWETLFRDRTDGRLWERFYPQSEMQGGGPESLRSIDSTEAAQKYGIAICAATTKRDIDLIVEQLTATVPGIRIEQLQVAHPGTDDNGLWFINIPSEEKQVQIESSTARCPFLIESDFNDERFHGHTVQEVVATVKRLFSLA